MPRRSPKVSTIADNPAAFVWPSAMLLPDGRVCVPRQHGWTICKTTDAPAIEYAGRFQRREWGWDDNRLVLDAKVCQWMDVKVRVMEMR